MKKLLIFTFLLCSVTAYAQIDTSGFYMAKVLYEKKDLHGAETILKRIEKSAPDYAPCLYYLGLVFQDENNFNDAEKYYLLAGEKGKNYGEPYSDLSALMFEEHKYNDAVQYAKVSIDRDSTNEKAYINLASALYQIKKYDESREDFIKAAEINPFEVLNLGVVQLKQYNNPNGAIYYFTIVYKLYPTFPSVILNLGNTYRMIGNTTIATQIFENGYHAINPTDKMFELIYVNYFRLLLDNKQYRQIIKTAFNKVPGNHAYAYFYSALSNYALGNKAIFIRQANRYFKLSGKKTPTDMENWAKAEIK
ncbi:tetratricopeptide repeat protein [Microbacter margulisiae]|uniref:Tetratricopeptide (TPR) repeat protein n=1 Tax=Microbacter margulisiae TaxID=1350067 RepID=A0A7W5H1I7_9PORP|nr:tetratricopeptide repeat protein [Microbacter margulisiae]MBB3186740.1 tetratricopeptide (TPR) repeat protein [Microbacter margulisiae]